MSLSRVCPSCARGSIIIDPGPIFQPDTPTFMQGPEGSHFVSAFTYSEYFNLLPDDDVNTYQIDFYAGGVIGIDFIRGAIQNILPIFQENFESIVAYSLFEKIVYDLVVPDQICIGDWCFTPPFAGGSIITGYQYRIWILTRNTASPAAAHARGLIQVTAGLIIALAIAIPFIIGGILVLTGHIKFQDLVGALKDVLHAPGENIVPAVQAMAWPALAFGAGMIIVAALLPIAMSKITVGTSKALPVHAEISQTLGGRPAAAPRPRGR